MPAKMLYRVYYAKNPTFAPNPDLCLDTIADMLGTDYAHVRDVEADSLEAVFCEMQGEVWSPNGEARDLIRSKGLLHTSMSIGDLVYLPETAQYFEVHSVGFKELRKKGE